MIQSVGQFKRRLWPSLGRDTAGRPNPRNPSAPASPSVVLCCWTPPASKHGLDLNRPLPLVLTRGLVEDVFLAVDGQNAVLESALPEVVVSKQTSLVRENGKMHHLFLTRWTLSYMQSMM